MFGNNRNNNDAERRDYQKFYFQVNTKQMRSGGEPFFDVYHTVFEDGQRYKRKEQTDNVGGKIRAFYTYKDEFDGNELTKFVLELDDENCPYIDKDGNRDFEAKIRHTYEVSSIFSLKGQELANKLCRVLEEGIGKGKNEYISLRFQKQFDKNPTTGEWNVEKKDSKGRSVYNLNVFFKEEGKEKATMVMPLFAKEADFATHELNDKWVEAWGLASKTKSNVPMAEFFETLINETYRDKAYEMFRDRLTEKGIDVTMEVGDNGKVKYNFKKDDDNPDAKQPVTTGAETSGTEGAGTESSDDDLPF